MIDDKIVESMINESNYLKKLYEVFKMINDLVDGKLDENITLLTKLENDVYTVDGKVLDDQKRLSIELKKIICINEKNNDLNNREIISKKLENILEIMDEVFDNNINEYYILDSVRKKYDVAKKNAIVSMKKKIAVIESELDIPISFFEAATFVFIDLYKKYRNLYSDVSEKEIGDKYEYI